jgi:protein SCO1/2
VSESLPRQRALRWIVLGVVLALAGVAAYALGVFARPAPELAGTPLQDPPSAADVELVDAAGETVQLGDFEGEMQLLFFGYTRCPDVCPITLSRLAGIYRAAGEPGDVRVVMVTVDPQHDTPQIVQRYAAGFHPSFVGLSGSSEQVAKAAKRFYIGVNGSTPADLQHTDMVVVMDGEGRFRWVYSQADLPSLERDLPALRARL